MLCRGEHPPELYHVTPTAREAEKPKLAGRVEVDDAYLGGQRSGGKRGRGAACGVSAPDKRELKQALEGSREDAASENGEEEHWECCGRVVLDEQQQKRHLIIRVTHPVMMTRYGWGAVRAQA